MGLTKRVRHFGALAVVSAAMAVSVPGATVEIYDEVLGPTPAVLAYNLGHFFPGSNAVDRWRYSGASGARIFLNPAHFENSETARPGEAAVTDRQTFLARRSALRADPLHPDFIEWTTVEGRMAVPLSGNNRIVPRFALSKIHGSGGEILAQMTLSESGFPISGENDWRGRWVAWRTFYSVAFLLARDFEVQRFASHNEPNHPNSFIAPEAWMMRMRLASDAVESAIEDVNRIYGKELTPRFVAPVTAGAGGSAYAEYGKAAVSGMETNFLGEQTPGKSFFQMYAYQQYGGSPSGFANTLQDLRTMVSADLPGEIGLPPFGITEYNVHTGASYDGMTETPDTVAKAVRFGGISSALARSGMRELYAFKFGMTAYPSTRNFPVQKNGMLYVDNDREPYNYGGVTRSAEVYRLFNKAFAAGRERLDLEAAGSGGSELDLSAIRDPETGFVYLFSVNEGSGGVPLALDVSRLHLPDGNQLIVEDVSEWRSGIIRSIHRLAEGRVDLGTQPGNTVWLVSIPGWAQSAVTESSNLRRLPVTRDAMVKDGSNVGNNYGGSAAAWAKNDGQNRNARNVAFLQYELPEDWDSAGLQLATVAGGLESVQAHLYGIDNHDWDEATLTWANAPNLRQNVSAGNEIRHSVVAGAGESAHLLGQISATSNFHLRQVDVTEYVRRQTGGKASFMIVQEPRWDIDIHVETMPSQWSDLARGDGQADGLRVMSQEGADGETPASSLLLIEAEPQPVEFEAWIARQFPGIVDSTVLGRDADPDEDGLINWLEFAVGTNPGVLERGWGMRKPEEEGAAEFRYSRNKLAAGVDLVVETSSDLVHWTAENVEVKTVSESRRMRWESATVSERDSARLFFRIRIVTMED